MSSTATKKTILAFDLYGTLLSTASIAQKLSQIYPSSDGAALAQTWRKYQLEYTWRSNSMGLFIPFDAITRRSLVHTLREQGVPDAENKERLESMMHAYDELDTFPDVPPALEALARESSFTPVVFSNGTDSMVKSSFLSTLEKHRSLFKDLVTVEATKLYKPSPVVYKHLAQKVGKKDLSDIWLISGNPFDVVGAKAVGVKACWVDRAGEGWTDALGDGADGRPDVVVSGLGEVVEKVKGFGR